MTDREEDGIRQVTPEDVDKGRVESVRERRRREDNMNKKEKKEKEKKEKDKKKEKRKVHKKIIVDLRATKLHKDEWGIRLDEQRKSKDRQWTGDMDMIGHVKVDGDDWGKLGIREKAWKTTDPLEKIFVMKAFTPSVYWRGTIELLQGESIMLSHVTNESCPAYLCNIDGSLNLIRIKRLPHFPKFKGETFGFEITEENGTHHSFVIDDKRLTLGSDWYIKNIYDEVVGIIDGKFLNLGGRFDIKIFDEELANNKDFYTSLVLFASTLRWYNDIRKNIKEMMKILKHQKNTKLKLRESESDLYLNPRKLNY